jgi:hypothetical protein
MYTSKCGSVILLLLMLTSSMHVYGEAAGPWTDNVLGIWFDDEALSPCTDTSESFQEAVGYVIIRGLPFSAAYVELGLTIEGEENLSDVTVTLSCGMNAIDSDRDFVICDCWMPAGSNIQLMTISVTVIDPDFPILFYLRPFGKPLGEPHPACVDSPCYHHAAGLAYSFLPSSGFWDLPVAAINGGDPCTVVHGHSLEWGSVKALYK